ncbi:hypothetical protein, partial [Streptosporangium album]|uniref:hypothetical protein n=1 Tax=Streptosporangium album TaxID=47479 RepID=UPI0031E5B3FA
MELSEPDSLSGELLSSVTPKGRSVRKAGTVLIKKCGRDTGLTTYQALFSQVTSLKDEVFRQKRGTVCGRAGP